MNCFSFQKIVKDVIKDQVEQRGLATFLEEYAEVLVPQTEWMDSEDAVLFRNLTDEQLPV